MSLEKERHAFVIECMKSRIDDIIVKGKRYRDPEYSAEKLAGELGVSVYQLARGLRKEYGMTYADLVLGLRVKEAKKHLRNPKKAGLLVEEVGLLVGFKNKWSFFMAFRKYAGMTPGEWKEMGR